MNVGDISVKISFGVDASGGNYFVLNSPVKGELNNATYLLAPDTVQVDVTDHVASITINRGRERELDEYATGTATIVFNDDDRTFDPAYSGSPYAGQITPMRRIVIAWHGYYLFTGWVDSWSVTYEPGDHLSRVTASCVDGFAILASQELDEIAPSFTGDTSGQRINRVLDLAEVTYPASRLIDTGLSTLGNTTYGTNALAYLQACTRAEAGYLFVSADGSLTFRNRNATLNTGSNVVFSDNRADGLPYMEITQHSSSDLLYTRVTGESETTGTAQSATNTTAAAEFLIRTLALGSLFVVNDAQALNLIRYYLSRFGSTELRFGGITVNLEALSAERVGTILDLDLTDLVHVQRSPLTVGAMIDRLSIIDGVTHQIGRAKWTVGLALANANTRTVFKLNDPVFGELNARRLAF